MAKKIPKVKTNKPDEDTLVNLILAGSKLSPNVKNLKRFVKSVKTYAKEANPNSRLGLRSKNSAAMAFIWSELTKISKRRPQPIECPDCALKRRRKTMNDTELFQSLYPDINIGENEDEKTTS